MSPGQVHSRSSQYLFSAWTHSPLLSFHPIPLLFTYSFEPVVFGTRSSSFLASAPPYRSLIAVCSRTCFCPILPNLPVTSQSSSTFLITPCQCSTGFTCLSSCKIRWISSPTLYRYLSTLFLGLRLSILSTLRMTLSKVCFLYTCRLKTLCTHLWAAFKSLSQSWIVYSGPFLIQKCLIKFFFSFFRTAPIVTGSSWGKRFWRVQVWRWGCNWFW